MLQTKYRRTHPGADPHVLTIHHYNSNTRYRLFKTDENFVIESGHYQSSHSKSDLYTAIWYLIDWIRMVSFTNLNDEDIEKIRKISVGQVETGDKGEIMNIICGRKINRVFYEHAYGVIFEAFEREDREIVVLDNNVNFFLYEEVLQLLRFRPLRHS